MPKPYKAATVCKTEGCSEPVKRTRKGIGLGHCAEHWAAKSIRRPVGSRYIAGDGYVVVKLPDGRLIGEHRAVMEQQLGRKLTRGETVHHVNGVRDDNRPENLELWYSPQPYGQRVEDLLRYAVTVHRESLLALLAEAPVVEAAEPEGDGEVAA